MQEFLGEVDWLFQQPVAAQAAYAEIVREDAVDRLGRAAGNVADIALDLIGLAGPDEDSGEHHGYLRLSVRLLTSNSQVLGAVEIDDKKVYFSALWDLIHRCLYWCVPRRLPLVLAIKHGFISQQFQAPPLERVATWDLRYPFGVPTEQLGLQRQLPILAAAGWRVELAGPELRLVRHTPISALQRGFSALFGGDAAAPGQGDDRIIEAGRWGLRFTYTEAGRVVDVDEFAITDIGAVTALRGESDDHHLFVFSAGGIETFSTGTVGSGIGTAEAICALERAIVSALVGAV
ncbi:MAG: hypothetical protein R6X02_33715 [Enhygromyxa sp.]